MFLTPQDSPDVLASKFTPANLNSIVEEVWLAVTEKVFNSSYQSLFPL